MASGSRIRKNIQPDIESLNNLERLLFSQAVYEFGSNAWPDVAKLLSKHPLISRPKQFFNPQSCALIYDNLVEVAGLELTETDVEKHSQGHLTLARGSYATRIIELKELITVEEEKFKAIVSEIDDIRAGRWDHRIMKELGFGPPAEEVQREHSPNTGSPHTKIMEEVQPDPMSPKNAAIESPPPALEEVSSAEDASQGSRHRSSSPSPRSPQASLAGSTDTETVPEQSPQPSPLRDPSIPPTPEYEGQHQVPDVSEVPCVGAVVEPETRPTTPLEQPGEVLRVDDPKIHPADPPKNDVSDSVEEPTGDSVIDPRHDRSAALPPSQQTTPMDVDELDSKPLDYRTGAFKPDLEPASQPLAAPNRLEGKRKISDADSPPGEQRERKRSREDSEPAEEEEPGPSVAKTRRKSQAPPEGQVISKKFQNVIGMLHSTISQHRYGNIFHNPIKKSEAPDYHDIVKRPMDLKTIKARVKDGVISNSLEFQRDVYLMFANAMMYNRPGSEIFNMAEEMMLESEVHINTFRQTEGFHRG